MAPKSKASESPSSPSAPFKPGSAVEVSSDEDGFRGSWFTGTIVRRLKPDRFLVEYDNLVDDEECSKRLRETLYLHQLRPLPPAESHPEFKFGDEVDAFHNDGWWEGHITKDFGNGRFAVYFRVSKEQIVFPKEKLRIHREWHNENWVPPVEPQLQDNETVTEEGFRVGARVEVSSDDDGFQGAWFSATIVQAMKKRKFIVEYKDLLDDNVSKKLLRETVDIIHIRPGPHPTPDTYVFGLLDEVDAWYNDGWWIGVISKVLGNLRYMVYFRSTDEELEFLHSDLRLHQDWMGGKWLKTSEALKL